MSRGRNLVVVNPAVRTVDITTALQPVWLWVRLPSRLSLNGSSGTASLTVTLPPPRGSTSNLHVDNNRSGLNPYETSLLPPTWRRHFGKAFTYWSTATLRRATSDLEHHINGARHNVLYVADRKRHRVRLRRGQITATALPWWHTLPAQFQRNAPQRRHCSAGSGRHLYAGH